MRIVMLTVMFFLARICSEATGQETIHIPAHYDENGNCTDLVVGYGNVLEPIDGHWVFTVDQDTVRINGLPLDPLRKDKKSSFKYEPSPSEIMAIYSKQHQLNVSAGRAFHAGGVDSVISVYEASSLVEEVGVLSPGEITVVWGYSGKEIVSFSPQPWEPMDEGKRLEKSIETFSRALKEGRGIVFRQGSWSHMPPSSKTRKLKAVRKLDRGGKLTDQEIEDLEWLGLKEIPKAKATQGIGDDLYESIILDVGENGVCMYGHWLSGLVEVRLDNCNVFINGFMAFPSVPPEGVNGKDEDCSDRIKAMADGRYALIKTILDEGRLYIITSWVTQNFPRCRRHSKEVQDEISRAINAKSVITGENWHNSILYPTEAEQIRNPLPVEKCGGF